MLVIALQANVITFSLGLIPFNIRTYSPAAIHLVFRFRGL